ncbi:hypothetical protein EVAR_18466_1 [Eumeta japonica]|uniref:Uncharacterized protein n=1 Tax=Eumeta variegata TaxID=151549 RepID=A0A4C1V0Y6_EUMVA|nr:hypothetical protein EVAR_18466_1 [Eumeta japonica]
MQRERETPRGRQRRQRQRHGALHPAAGRPGPPAPPASSYVRSSMLLVWRRRTAGLSPPHRAVHSKHRIERRAYVGGTQSFRNEHVTPPSGSQGAVCVERGARRATAAAEPLRPRDCELDNYLPGATLYGTDEPYTGS